MRKFKMISAIVGIPALAILVYLIAPVVYYYNTCATEVDTWEVNQVFDMDDGLAAGVYYAPVDENGQPKKIYSTLPRYYKWEEIPEWVKKQWPSVEQKGFFTDSLPINFWGMGRAVVKSASEGKIAGSGSTLTQMLARTQWLGYAQTRVRKQKEIAYAFRLDKKYSRQQQFSILYSRISLGTINGIPVVGFPQGSRVIFNKSIEKLNPEEQAILIGLPKGPTYYSPAKSDKTKQNCADRRDVVLQVWANDHLISQSVVDKAKGTPIKVSIQRNRNIYDGQQDAVDTAKKSVRKHLRLAADDNSVDDDAIVTTLNETMQKLFTEAFGKVPKGMQGIGIVMDAETGKVLALYGGRDSYNRLLALIQPGSVDKIFSYLKALEDGLIAPDSTFMDEKKDFVYGGGQTYAPPALHPYSNQEVNVRDAFAYSNNGIALQAGQLVGWANLVSFFRELDLESHDEKGAGKLLPVPTLPMGTFETTIGQLVGALSAVANGGTMVSPRYIEYVRTENGTVYGDDKFTPEKKEVFSAKTADTMLSLMQGVTKYGTGTGVYKDGYTGAVAGKTGSSERFGWFVGVTRGGNRKFAFAIGVGYDSSKGKTPQQLKKVFGGKLAVPVASKFLAELQRTGKFSQYFGSSFEAAPAPTVPPVTPTPDPSDVDITVPEPEAIPVTKTEEPTLQPEIPQAQDPVKTETPTTTSVPKPVKDESSTPEATPKPATKIRRRP